MQEAMSRRLPPISALRALDAAAGHLSFTRAARELNVTPSAISHQIKTLEDLWGVRLFERRKQRPAFGLGARAAKWVGFNRGAAAVDVQPILNGEILEIAEPGIDPEQRRIRIFVPRHAGLGRQPRPARGLDDQFGQAVAAATAGRSKCRLEMCSARMPSGASLSRNSAIASRVSRCTGIASEENASMTR